MKNLPSFAGISDRNMGYAGLKDRHGITEQWFCLQMPGKETPDFSQFNLEGVEILDALAIIVKFVRVVFKEMPRDFIARSKRK